MTIVLLAALALVAQEAGIWWAPDQLVRLGLPEAGTYRGSAGQLESPGRPQVQLAFAVAELVVFAGAAVASAQMENPGHACGGWPVSVPAE